MKSLEGRQRVPAVLYFRGCSEGSMRAGFPLGVQQLGQEQRLVLLGSGGLHAEQCGVQQKFFMSNVCQDPVL